MLIATMTLAAGVSTAVVLGARDPRALSRSILSLFCGMRSGTACFELGLTFHKGLSLPIDKERAARFYQRACESGYAGGCQNLASMLAAGELGDSPNSKPRAIEMMSRACELDVRSCFGLAVFYLNGTISPANIPRAIWLNWQVCEAHEAVGCEKLAFAFQLGTGVEVDLTLARAINEHACKLSQRSCWRLEDDGVRGLLQDESACDGGKTLACEQAAHRLLRDGADDPAKKLKALRLLEKSCDLGDADGCFEAAEHAAKIDPDDREQPHRLLIRGCQLDPADYRCGKTKD